MPAAPTLLLALLGPALVLSADPGRDLVTAAGASARPPECSARAQSGRAPSVWERARTPQRAAFCAALAEAHARLGTDPEGARAAAARAEAAWPGRAATRVALARVQLARGEVKAALASFDEAQRLDRRAVGDPASLRDLARALARGDRPDAALEAYRALVPQSSLLPRSEQAAALLEAGLVSMTAAAPAGDAAPLEALAFLREARSLPSNPMLAETALVLALALDRSGDAAGAASQLADATRMGASAERAALLATDRAEGLALAALALEATDRTAAVAAWDRYLAEAPRSRWRAAAERRRDQLRGAPRPSSGPRAARPRSGAR